METTNDAVLRAYEVKIAELDKTRALLQEKACQGLPVLSVADTLAEAICRIHNDQSVSSLFRV